MSPKKKDSKIYICLGIAIFILLELLGLHAGHIMDTNSKTDAVSAFIQAIDTLSSKPFDFTPITDNGIDCAGFMCIVSLFVLLAIYLDSQKKKNFLPGKESGSAKWYTDMNKYNKKYTDPKGSTSNSGDRNLIVSNDVFLNMNGFETRLNNNIVVIGGSGAGKSRFFVKPNILQANCNYVITDPAGELLETQGPFLEQQGYEIKIFNLTEMNKSHSYNPFEYIRNDEGVLMMIDCLITNTNPPGKKGGDPFWEKSETALLQALCFYLRDYRPKEEQNFNYVMKLIRAAEIDENDPKSKSPLDLIFDDIKEKDPDSLALKSYMTFKMGAGKTLKSILISCAVRLQVFNLAAVANLTGIDTIDLASMGVGKKALFVITPQASETYNFLVSMLYTQLFETLYFLGDTDRSKLRRDVRFLLDEFVNIGQIPEFTKKLATMRKYGISCSIILQNLAQIKALYKDDWETIIGNCDTMLFLGGSEYTTLEYISKILGNTTISVKNTSTSKGKSSSSSTSVNRTKRELMLPDEIGNMDNSYCIIKIRSLDPFFTKKYDYPRHPNYQYTGDADPTRKYINTLDNTKPINTKKSKMQQNKNASSNLDLSKISIRSVPEYFDAFSSADAKDVFEHLNIIDAFGIQYGGQDAEVQEAIVATIERDAFIENINAGISNIFTSNFKIDIPEETAAPVLEKILEKNEAVVAKASQNFFIDGANSQN